MTETSFNKHIKTFSSAFAHSKYVSKLFVVPKSWFLFIRNLWWALYEIAARGKQRDKCDIIFMGRKTTFFSADRPLEHVGWLTDEIAVKGKNRDICHISFSQSKCDKQSLRFKLLFNIWIHSRFHGLMHMEISRVQFFLTSFKVASLIFVISVCRGW